MDSAIALCRVFSVLLQTVQSDLFTLCGVLVKLVKKIILVYNAHHQTTFLKPKLCAL